MRSHHSQFFTEHWMDFLASGQATHGSNPIPHPRMGLAVNQSEKKFFEPILHMRLESKLSYLVAAKIAASESDKSG